MLIAAMPPNFGSIPPRPLSALKPTMDLFRKLDVVGSFLLLSGSLLLVCVLNEAYQEFKWSSATAIGLLALCGAAWVEFFVWEWLISDAISGFDPIFPKRFLFNRAWMGMLM